MEETKHTAGPWKVAGNFDDDCGISIETADDMCLQVVEIEPLTGEWSAEEIANARLIAAAPVLYEGCLIAAKELEECAADVVGHPSEVGFREKAKFLRAALASAVAHA